MPGFSKLKKKNLVDNKKTLPLHSRSKKRVSKKVKRSLKVRKQQH